MLDNVFPCAYSKFRHLFVCAVPFPPLYGLHIRGTLNKIHGPYGLESVAELWSIGYRGLDSQQHISFCSSEMPPSWHIDSSHCLLGMAASPREAYGSF